MIRIFLSPEQLVSDKISITGDQARHLALVLRARPGDPVTIFDGRGFKYICTILQSHKKEVTAECISKEPYSSESPVLITLAQGLAKGDKMDYIVQKSTELGVTRIIPLITERSQVRHTEKTGRWRRIALSASQQSGRSKVPDIDEPVSIDEFFSRHITPSARSGMEEMKGVKPGTTANIIFSEEHKKQNLKQILTGLGNVSHITLLIGPEGGFSIDEVSTAVAKGFIEVSLGPRILRTETAPLSALSIIQYELGDAG